MSLKLIPLLAVVALLGSSCGEDDAVAGGAALGPEGTPAGDGSGDGATEVTVVVTGGEFDRLTYTITCGDQPVLEPPVDALDPATACRRLTDPAVVQRLAQGPPADQMCTEVYGGPQEATITGTIDGVAVDATVSRVNGCEIDTWDRLLAGILPPTQGVQGG